MSVQPKISALTANGLKDWLKNELAEKRERLRILESECAYVETLITVLNVNQTIPSSEFPNTISSVAIGLGYKDAWTWEKKIKFILEYKGNVGLTTSGIVTILIEMEPDYFIKERRSKAVASISAVLSSKTKEGVFYKKINDRNQNIYFISPF